MSQRFREDLAHARPSAPIAAQLKVQIDVNGAVSAGWLLQKAHFSRRLTQLDSVDPHGPRYIFELALLKVDEFFLYAITDLSIGILREADPDGLGDSLKPAAILTYRPTRPHWLDEYVAHVNAV